MSPQARDGSLDDRARLERDALELAFAANRIAELGDDGASRIDDVLAKARALERDADALAPTLDPCDRVLAFVRLVLSLLPQELDVRQPDPASSGPGRSRPART